MEEITLRTGKEVPKVLYVVTYTVLEAFFDQKVYPGVRGALAFYELVEKARDPNHVIWGDYADVLNKTNLLDHKGEVHGAVADIVLACADGDGLELTLTSGLP